MLSIFRKAPLLPQESIDWLVDGFAWCLQNFGSDLQQTILVQPQDNHFPGREQSMDGMAALILQHVQRHSGLEHWPLRAVDHHQATIPVESPVKAVLQQPDSLLDIPYEPRQTANPEVMIANYIHTLAHHLGHLAQTPPPCDPDQWLHMMELLAVYMGFGIMLANTASPYRGGGCARCVSPALERQGFLSEDETTYALAIFCTLKQIPEKEVTRFLKSSLKPYFKKALKDVGQRENVLAQLRGISSNPEIRFIAN